MTYPIVHAILRARLDLLRALVRIDNVMRHGR
jgi:hypothetical protein